MPAACPRICVGPHPVGENGHAPPLSAAVGPAGTSLLTRHFFLSTASLWSSGSPSFQWVRPAGSRSFWYFVIWAPSSQHLGFRPGCLSTSACPRSGNSSSTELAWQAKAFQQSGGWIRPLCTQWPKVQPSLLIPHLIWHFHSQVRPGASSAFRCSFVVR